MNNRHLEYHISIPIRVCTDKTQRELEEFLTSEINNTKGIYATVYDFKFKEVTLCDCEKFECQEEEYNK
jgi:hypothetical protein